MIVTHPLKEPTGTLMTDGGVVSPETDFTPEVIRDQAGMGHDVRADVGSLCGY